MRKIWIFLIMLGVLLSPPALAFGPRTHFGLMGDLCAESNDWPNKRLCCVEHYDACITGNVLTDSTVFHYVTSFRKYQGTHNWGNYERCVETARDREEEAFCVGVGLHLAQDSVSHNMYVPETTQHWSLFAEAVTHPFIESNLDNDYIRKNPNMDTDLTYYLSDENLIKFCGGEDNTNPDNIMYRSTGMDLHWECNAVVGAVSEGGMYQSVFLAGWFMNTGYDIFIKLSDFLPALDWQPYEQKAKELSRQVFQDNPPRQYDPTGFEALNLAEVGYKFVTWIIIIALAILIMVIIIRRVRKR